MFSRVRWPADATAAPTAGRSLRTFVARQAIFDDELRVRAYELLFRAGLDRAIDIADSNRAASRIIADSSLVMDLASLTSGARAFVNVTRDVLLAGQFRVLPRRSTVLEILETVDPDDAVIDACRAVRRDGYRLALDDFRYTEAMEPLLELAEVVKIDWLSGTPAERERLARRLRGARVRLLAEKVESPEMLDEARRLGCSLFQGFFFSKPAIVSAQDVPPDKNALLGLLREIHRKELDYDGMERAIKRDPGLCYKLLRYINAVRHGLRYRIGSIRRALILLGLREIRRWASLVVVSMISHDRPREVVRHALVRARFWELLAPRFGLEARSDDLFLMGMFSLTDTLMGRPLEEILRPLPIAEDVKASLAGEDGELGALRDFGRHYERGEWERIGRGDEPSVTRLYVDAVSWANRCTAAGSKV